MGSSTEHSAYGPVRNPLDRSTACPAARPADPPPPVAAGIVRHRARLRDRRIGAAARGFCGIVGVKPTYGRVSRYGLVAFASSLDHVGVFGRPRWTTRAGSASSRADRSTRSDVDRHAAPISRRSRTRRARDLVASGSAAAEYFPAIARSARSRAGATRRSTRCAALGATVREVSLPHTDLAIPVYYIVAPAEASSNLARFDGVRYGLRARPARGCAGMYQATRARGFGPEVTRRILLGTYVLSAGYYDAYYRKAQQVRALIARTSVSVFDSGVHLLLTPTTPTPAFQIGAKTDPVRDVSGRHLRRDREPRRRARRCRCPSGDVDGLPVGGQLIAPHFEEARMLAVAYALERALGARRTRDDACSSLARDGRRPRGARPAQARARRCSAACCTAFGAPPNTNVCPVCLALPGALPVLNDAGGRASRCAPRSRSAATCSRARLRPQELLLSRSAEGIPDLAVRPAARRAAGARRSGARRRHADRVRHHPPAHGGGRGKSIHDRFPGVDRRRPQSRGRAAHRDRERARHALARARPARTSARSSRSSSTRDVSDVQHGGGQPARGRERQRAPPRRDHARHEDRSEEHELLLRRRARARGRVRAAVRGARRRGGTVEQQTMLWDAQSRRGAAGALARKGATTIGTSRSPTCRRSCSRASGSMRSAHGAARAARRAARALRRATTRSATATSRCSPRNAALADYFEEVVAARTAIRRPRPTG